MNKDKLLEYGAIITGTFNKNFDITQNNTSFFQKEFRKNDFISDIQLEYDQKKIANQQSFNEVENETTDNIIFTKEGRKRIYSPPEERYHIPSVLTQEQISLIRRKQRSFLEEKQKYKEYGNLIMHLKSFKIVNQAIILKLLRNNLLKKSEENALIELLENYTEEKKIIAWCQKKIERFSITQFVYNPKIIKAAAIFLILSISIFCIVGIRYLQVKDIYDRGHQAIQNNSFKRGEILFDKALNKWSWISECHRYAKVYIKKKKYDLAYQKYQKALSISSKDYKTLSLIVKLAIHQKKYKEAEKLYKKVNDFYPNDIASLKWLSEMYIEWSKKENQYLNKANKILNIVKEKDNFFYLAKQMSIAIIKDKYDDVVEISKNLEKINSTRIDKISSQDFIRYMNDKYKKIVINKNNQNNEAEKFNKELLYIQKKVESFQNSLAQKFPNDMVTTYLTAKWYFLKNEINSSIVFSKQSESLWKKKIVPYYFNDSQIFDLLGILEYKLKNYKKAKENFNKAIRINGGNFDSYYYLGNIFLKDKNYYSSATIYFKAIEFGKKKFKQWDKDYEGCLYKIGYSYYQLAKESEGQQRRKNLINCISYWNQINLFNLKENKFYIQYILANSYLLLGEYELAYGYYNNNIVTLKNEYNQFIKSNNKNSSSIKMKLSLLSEMENNIVIAESYLNNDDKEINYKQKAFINIISSIQKNRTIQKSSKNITENLGKIIRNEDNFTIVDNLIQPNMIKLY